MLGMTFLSLKEQCLSTVFSLNRDRCLYSIKERENPALLLYAAIGLRGKQKCSNAPKATRRNN